MLARVVAESREMLIRQAIATLETARAILSRLKEEGVFRGKVYVKKVRKYSYGILILPAEVCRELVGKVCEAKIVGNRVEYVCREEDSGYKVFSMKRVCGIRFPFPIDREVLIERTANGFVVHL